MSESQMDAARLSTDNLARHCVAETARFRQQHSIDTGFCFELFRRALEQRDGDAFNHIYLTYQQIVFAWISNDPLFLLTNEDAEYFVVWAFHTFSYALQGKKFQRFSELSRLLAYLRSCAHTAILQHLRAQRRRNETIPLNPDSTVGTSSQNMTAHIELHELWAHIEKLLVNVRERQIVYVIFVQGYKPREIPEVYPKLARDANEAIQLLYRARRRLRDDSFLRNLYELL
jgi:hypothetical protein